MTAYEEKQEARRQRYLDHAAKADDDAGAAYQKARDMAAAIPFGQPILVGHYSETGDRNYRRRIHDTFGKSFALSAKAADYQRKAEAVGTGGISSDDPEAIDKLKAELAAVHAAREKMKEANKAIRRGDRGRLAELGFSEKQIDALFKPDCCGRIGFASYAVSNNNANARRIEKRIADLEAKKAQIDIEEQADGYTYREDTTENRAMFIFPGKPDDETRSILKKNAFKWSPTRGAWVRQLTGAARFAATTVRQDLKKIATK